MNDATGRLQRGLLVVALVQGVLGDGLLRAVPWGLGLAIWVATGVSGIACLTYRERVQLPRATWGWFLAAWGCAAMLAVRDAGILTAWTLMGGIGCLILGAWSARGGTPFRATATTHVVQAVTAIAQAWFGGFAWLAAVAGRPSVSSTAPARPPFRPWARGLVGLLLAAPVLILFGTLFAAADPVFAKGVRSLVNLDYQTLASHALLIGVWAWICAGYGRHVLVARGPEWLQRLVPSAPTRPPATEVLTGLGMLALLFLAFVAVQLRYLYGNDALVQATVGMTYAEYARQGFFELLAVALLLLPLLLGCDWLVSTDVDRRGFQLVAGLLLALLGVILLSAAKRLGLYTAAYGLTEPRLYAAAVLGWVALVTVWFALTVLPGRRDRYVGGAIVAALAVLTSLHLLDPDAFIARHNLARARDGLRFDVAHFLRLGPGAAPVLLRELGALPPADQAKIREALGKRWRESEDDWRKWNLARQRAHEAVIASGPASAPAPAPAPAKEPNAPSGRDRDQSLRSADPSAPPPPPSPAPGTRGAEATPPTPGSTRH